MTTQHVTGSLRIRIKKMADGAAALTCTRADGTTTWQRQNGSLGRVFPFHDITHYVVETELGYARGFYGLISEGWDITDFASPWPRGEIPAEAREVEFMVGLFDLERRMDETFTSAQVREEWAKYNAGRPKYPIDSLSEFSDEALARVRARRLALYEQWHAVKAGDALEMEFVALTAR